MRFRLAFSVLILAALPAGAVAAELPVATREELTVAVRRAQPGDTIVLRDGTWADARIVFQARGRAGAPITLRAQTPGGVILTGRSSLRLAGEHLVASGLVFREIPGAETVVEFRSGSQVANDCRLTECAIIDCNPPDRKTNTKWVSLYGRRNRIDHCYVAGKTNLGTTLVVWLDDQPNGHRIDHNHFGPRPPLGENGGETIRIGTSDWSMHVSRTVVESNFFERCNGEVEIVSNKSCENVYRNNTFFACEGALTLRHGNRCVVEGNIFLGGGAPRTGGVRVIGEDHRVVNNYFEGLAGTEAWSALSLMQGIPDSPLAGYFQVKRAVIAFNTFVDCAASLVLAQPGRGASLPPEDVMLANNLVRVTAGQPAVVVPLEPVRLRASGNLLQGGTTAEAARFGARTVQLELIRGPDGLWRPGATCAAHGAAATGVEGVTHDLDGQPRPATGADVGCDQRSDAPARWRKIGPGDAGPTWRRQPER